MLHFSRRAYISGQILSRGFFTVCDGACKTRRPVIKWKFYSIYTFSLTPLLFAHCFISKNIHEGLRGFTFLRLRDNVLWNAYLIRSSKANYLNYLYIFSTAWNTSNFSILILLCLYIHLKGILKTINRIIVSRTHTDDLLHKYLMQKYI